MVVDAPAGLFLEPSSINWMFSFALPKEIHVSMKVAHYESNVITWNELQEVAGNIAILVGGPLHEEDKTFSVSSSDPGRLESYARSMVVFYDAFFEMRDTRRVPGEVKDLILPRHQPILTVHLRSNAVKPRALFTRFLDGVLSTLGMHMYFEPVEGGIIILVQDRASFLFAAHGVIPSFVDTVIEVTPALQSQEPRAAVRKILERLGVAERFSEQE